MINVRRIFLVVFSALLALGAAAPAYAINPHEDPAQAQYAYSAVTLFGYYSLAIDSILERDPDTVRTKLAKMPYANLPESVTQAAGNFVFAAEDCAWRVLYVEKDIKDLRGLLDQSRQMEVTPLADEIARELSLAYGDLQQAEDATVSTGAAFGVVNEPRTSDIRLAYEGTLRKIGFVRSMLDVNRNILADLLSVSTSVTGTATELTLTVQPASAFVGEIVSISGRLTTKGKPLAGRDIGILFNSENQGTVTTDAGGNFTALTRVPFWYFLSIQVQALYYPKGTDVGVYLSSLSSVATLQVLYYEASLSLSLDGTAYPGRETAIRGEAVYRPSAAPVARNLEIYIDNVLTDEFTSSGAFTRTIILAPDIKPGRHTVTVSAEAQGRYAPFFTDAFLEVRKADVRLGLNLPRVIFIPGGIDLNGGVSSDLGPLQGALVSVSSGKAMHEFRSSTDGSFQEKMRLPFEFGLVGSETLEVTVFPTEPWNQPLIVAERVFVINSITGGVFMVLILVMGVLLPRKLKIRAWHPSRRRKSLQPVVSGRVETPPVYSDLAGAPFPDDAGRNAMAVEPRGRILSWYTLILRLAQQFARVVLKPQHTLREFVAEAGKALGPLAGYLMEFTRVVEKLLYSRSKPTEADVIRSEQLRRRLQDGLRKKE